MNAKEARHRTEAIIEKDEKKIESYYDKALDKVHRLIAHQVEQGIFYLVIDEWCEVVSHCKLPTTKSEVFKNILIALKQEGYDISSGERLTKNIRWK